MVFGFLVTNIEIWGATKPQQGFKRFLHQKFKQFVIRFMANPQPHIQCKPAQEVTMACNFSCDELEFVVIF